MKRFTSLLAFSVIASMTALAQGPNAPTGAKFSSLGLKVKEIGTKKQDVDRWRNSWGEYGRNTTRQKTLQVELTKFGKDPANEVKISILWVARPAETTGGEYIFKRDEATVSIAGQMEVLSFTSPPITERVHRYWGGAEYSSGTRLAGYVYWYEYAGESSKPQFSTGLNNISAPEKLKALVKTYEEKLSGRGRYEMENEW